MAEAHNGFGSEIIGHRFHFGYRRTLKTSWWCSDLKLVFPLISSLINGGEALDPVDLIVIRDGLIFYDGGE